MKWQARGIAMRPAQKNGAKCAHKPRSRVLTVGLRIRLLDLRLVALACGIGRPERPSMAPRSEEDTLQVNQSDEQQGRGVHAENDVDPDLVLER